MGVLSTECDVPVPGIPGTGNFSFFWWYRNRYRNKLVPEKSLGTGIGKIWYREKVSEPVSAKFGTGKKSRNWYQNFFDTGTVLRCQNLGILKICNGYRYQEFYIFLVVSEPVLEKFGTGKKSRNRYRKNLVPEKKSWNRYRKNSIPELIFVAKVWKF